MSITPQVILYIVIWDYFLLPRIIKWLPQTSFLKPQPILQHILQSHENDVEYIKNVMYLILPYLIPAEKYNFI